MKLFSLPSASATGLLCAGLLLGLGALLPAQASDTEDETSKEWQEAPLQLPATPKPDNLIEFYRSASQLFAIDGSSISIAADNSIRYTLVATSGTGVKNISYEAIRCDSYIRKLYAFGRPDGSWSPSRRNEWDRISTNGTNLPQHVLYTDFFCEGNTIAGKVPLLLRRFEAARLRR
ncbi:MULTISPECIES: CNP1-like family protein [unclassified Undibacterium]|uniref:CNP1-like family protein n=1 Tax=unclassified Undibacterium TaxID=2630295 RepID=UPI002AC8D97E|nr:MULTISPECIES: CNP1-like family protein [unclassified Undibacterium]MEB0141136.1 CNP1-like family protein [Undibacterium sp. CCC2.1]MEB0174169.1 CNP1-like family protein [Undibacterium sp. CCC1.1]MEB0178111.1 CNP1-like family protein [Undibacterium sp. CCC3.4]MEB0217323.1 CNP1-like family protein [Undibacterium sp. 5I2]WPX45327.1 CNP1-like family protein [Undibacterium sp. CCC3.4]